MKTTTFFLSHKFELAEAAYLVDYHKYWLDRSAGIKNPNFNRESGMILDIKTGEKAQNFNSSLIFFAKKLLVDLKANQDLWNTKLQIAIVPSSTKGVTSKALTDIAKVLAAKNSNYSFNGNPLSRKHSIPKLATGGSRAYGPMYDSLEIDSDDLPLSKVCMLLDDVITSGTSISSCIAHLGEVGFTRIIPIALGKTVND